MISLALGLLLLVPVALKILFPYLWLDVLFFVDIMRIFVAFVSRRRKKPAFFALDRFLEQVAAVPDKSFMVFGDERYTFALVDEQSNRIANALRAHPGYTPGDTVALFMGNEPAFVTTWLALAKLGSPVALLNSNIRSKSLLHCFNCCRATVLIAASGRLTTFAVSQQKPKRTYLMKNKGFNVVRCTLDPSDESCDVGVFNMFLHYFPHISTK